MERYLELMVENPEVKDIKEIFRTVIYDTKTDVLYMPATTESMTKTHIGTPVIQKEGMLFFPISWFISEYPELPFEQAEKNLRQIIAIKIKERENSMTTKGIDTYEQIMDEIVNFQKHAQKYYDKGSLAAGKRARVALDKIAKLKVQWRKELVAQ